MKLCSNTSIIYLNVSKVIFAPFAALEMRGTQIFLLFFRNFFFVYRHSDLEGSCSNETWTKHVNHVGTCGPSRVTRADIGLHDLNHLRKGIVDLWWVCLGGIWTEDGLTFT